MNDALADVTECHLYHPFAHLPDPSDRVDFLCDCLHLSEQREDRGDASTKEQQTVSPTGIESLGEIIKLSDSYCIFFRFQISEV